MSISPIPVRKLHDDGFITVQYVNPDGSRFDDELPEGFVFAANPNPITALWDEQYRIGDEGHVNGSEIMANLKHLSDVDSFLFEEVLLRLEGCHRNELLVWKARLATKTMHPTDHRPNENYAPVFRSMLKTVPIASELTSGSVFLSNHLISRARKVVGYLGNENLAATVLCVWVSGDINSLVFPKLSYQKYRADIEFVDAHLESVMSVRDTLKRLKTFQRKDVSELISNALPLSSGAL